MKVDEGFVFSSAWLRSNQKPKTYTTPDCPLNLAYEVFKIPFTVHRSLFPDLDLDLFCFPLKPLKFR
jgi:hypothetical protein